MASEHFSDDELKCKHCGEVHMDEEFMEVLEDIRNAFGKPMYVNSGYRCPVHNSNVSSTGPTGPHTTGKAIDIRIYGYDAYRLIGIAYSHGITGIGVNQKGPMGRRFVHLDIIHSDLRPRVWSY
jgi:zinc D-Ala-D-Ala carboxypeptidase